MKQNKPLKAKTSLKKTKSIPKKSSIGVAPLKDKLDKKFGLYVRLRDSNLKGMGKCITCPRVLHYTEVDPGHFQSRRWLNTRWDEQNVNFQCKSCNGFHNGEQAKYARELELKYGDGTAIYLEDLAHDPEPAFPQKNKAYREWLQEQIDYYTEQVHEQLRSLDA